MSPKPRTKEAARLYMRQWRAKNPDKARASSRRAYHKNPEYHRLWERRNRVKRTQQQRDRYSIEKRLYRYRLTLDQYHAMLESQGELCKICKAVLGPTSNKTHIDHDPKLGLTHVRGLLCGSCNKGLGYFKDRPELMRAAAAYVEEA